MPTIRSTASRATGSSEYDAHHAPAAEQLPELHGATLPPVRSRVKLLPTLLAVAALVRPACFAWKRRWRAGRRRAWSSAAGRAVFGSGIIDCRASSRSSPTSAPARRLDVPARRRAWPSSRRRPSSGWSRRARSPSSSAASWPGQGAINPVALFFLVWFCAAAGDSTGYLLGRKLGRELGAAYGRSVGVTARRFDAVEHFFIRHGGKTIFIGRFIGFFRSLGPFVAGSARVPYRRFLAASLAGAGLWSAVFVDARLRLRRSLHRALSTCRGEHRLRCPRRRRRGRLRPLPPLAQRRSAGTRPQAARADHRPRGHGGHGRRCGDRDP